MHRLRVLIADDEMIIREGIKDAVDWNKLQLDVVAEAEDGEEALELALLHNVHILLADLNMPIMNGLTLIKNIRQHLPECRTIIITGHDEFSYAQEAIRLNVTDYILKPVNPEQLENVLTNVSKDLRVEATTKANIDSASKQITKNIAILREKFCQGWLEGNFTEEEIMEQLDLLKLPASTPDFLGIIRWPEIVTNQHAVSENEVKKIVNLIKDIIMQVLEKWEKVIFRDAQGLIVVIVWGDISEDIFHVIDVTIKNDLKIMTIQHFEKVTSQLNHPSEIYLYCKEHVFKKKNICQLVRRAEQYIQHHYHNNDLSLETVAKALQVSSVYLSRIIKQDIGISFVHLLTKVRIKKAIELLNSTDLTINEISEKVGYDTQHYFSTSFKKVMGISPNRYRNGEGFSNKQLDRLK